MSLHKVLLAAAFAALLSPVAALAQQGPPAGGPPPEMRAQFETARTNAKTAAFNDLSADHRAKVNAIVAQVQSGSLDPHDAASQIDAILTPAESQAVLGEQQKMRDAMRKAFESDNGGQMPQGQYGGQQRPGMGGGGTNRKPDAGRFLLMISREPRTQP